jgi:hypothetical protein
MDLSAHCITVCRGGLNGEHPFCVANTGCDPVKKDGRLCRNWLKGSDGDAFHALLCGCGHNLRMILRKL